MRWLMDNKFNVKLGTCKIEDKDNLDVAWISPYPAIEEYESSTICILSLLELTW